MYNKDDEIKCTTHSINPVPFIICENFKFIKNKGSLADIAPTILKIMNIIPPEEMQGSCLIE
jgi:2,3-bisphosphoglycerate-independent phosphoglycerate mutase